MNWLAEIRERVQVHGENVRRREQVEAVGRFIGRFPGYEVGEPSVGPDGPLVFPVRSAEGDTLADLRCVWGEMGAGSPCVVAVTMMRADETGEIHSRSYDFGEYAAPLAFLSTPSGRPTPEAERENDAFDSFDRSIR